MTLGNMHWPGSRTPAPTGPRPLIDAASHLFGRRQCCAAAARVLNVPRLRRLPVFGSSLRE